MKNIQIWHVSKAYMPDKLHFTATVRTSRSYCLKLSHHQKAPLCDGVRETREAKSLNDSRESADA
jgi:hypothetical protein